MKLYKIFLTVITGVFLCCSQSVAEETGYPVNECGGPGYSVGEFFITGFKEYPPFTWTEINESNLGKEEYRGFIAEYVKEALSKMKIIRVGHLVFNDFQQAQKAVLRGKADLLFTSYYLDETKSGQDYIYPAYFGNPFIVVSRATKKIDVEDVSGLKGLKGVIRREEEIESLIRGILPTDTKIDVVDGPQKAFRMLLSGEADFMISSPYAVEAEAKRFKIKDKLHYGTKVVRHIKYFNAFSKLSPCRKYKKLYAEKFAETIKDKAEMEQKINKYIQLWADMHANDPALEYEPAKD